jgi:hypothetical protein
MQENIANDPSHFFLSLQCFFAVIGPLQMIIAFLVLRFFERLILLVLKRYKFNLTLGMGIADVNVVALG